MLLCLFATSPALWLAPPAAAAAHRLAQPVMQFGALGGQTPFAPLGTAGGASSAQASGSAAVVGITGQVLRKKKKRKVDPNTGMLEQGAHRPDNSGVAHVPVPSPYHVFEPSMARPIVEACMAWCTAWCTARCIACACTTPCIA